MRRFDNKSRLRDDDDMAQALIKPQKGLIQIVFPEQSSAGRSNSEME